MIQTYDLHDLRRFTHGRGRRRGLHRRLSPADLRRFLYAAADTTAYVAGAASTWTSAGGSGIGGAITCTNLASGTARVGAKSGSLLIVPPNSAVAAVLPDYFMLYLSMKFALAPATGNPPVSLYLSFSNSNVAGTSNAGFAAASGGADAALGNVDQLPLMTFIGSLPVSNSIGTGLQQGYIGQIWSIDQYFSPVIYNQTATGQAFSSTAADTTLTMTPYFRQRAV